VARVFKTWSKLPELQFIRDYHHHAGYIEALASSVREVWQRDGEPERLLISFHGIPQRYAAAGDPYPEQCEHTANMLREVLGLGAERCFTSFQSRFGPEPWLQPYTDVTLREWGRSGVRHVDVVCPGFSADCLETLEEIEVQNRRFFLDSGGERFRYIAALNARDDHIAALADLVLDKLHAWDG
jgi:ferrochelatase